MDLCLGGRSVVVLGAGSGLGRATALAYADEGAAVTLFGRDAGRLEEAAEVATRGGGVAEVRAPGAQYDASNDAVITRLLAETVA